MAARTRTLGGSPLGLLGRRAQAVLAPSEAFRPGSGQAAGRSRMEERLQDVSLAQMDGWLLAAIASLCAFGLVMVYSASEALGYAWQGDPSFYFKRQLLWMAIGVVGMVLAARLDYHRWRQWVRPLAICSVGLLLLVLVPHLGTERLGARRWFSLGPLSVQPSAAATLMAIVCFSRWLVDRGPGVRSWRIARHFALLLGGLLALVVLERDLGSAIILAAVGLVLFALGGARKRHLLFILAGVVLAAWFAIRLEAYRTHRLTSFRDPFADPLNTGFQSVQSLLALGSGGFSGVGLGNSIQKYQWLPEAHTDFIFAIIGEELGLVGCLAVIAGFLGLGWRGIRASLRAPDRFGAMLAGGITGWICIQAFINIAAVTSVVPTTGIPLPFISYGGSSLAMTLVAVGVLCNVSAQGRRQGISRRAHVDRWRGNGGTSDSRARDRAGAAAH
jgi:cell division protein FtsW